MVITPRGRELTELGVERATELAEAQMEASQ
jgi:hypothetical protein